jgi:dTDP-4-dehydrorhamnose reductase
VKQVLVTGGTGQVGQALAQHAWPSGWEAVVADRVMLDLGNPALIDEVISSRPWSAVISSGAYTAVDRAEQEPAAAWSINAVAPAALARACQAGGIPIIQVSTDYVFDGSGTEPRKPDAPTAPINVYGASKLGGELAVQTGCQRHAIVRTSWVVSATGTNFIKTMLRLAGEREELRVVEDQIGAPTSARDLASALATVAVRLAQDEKGPTGTFHFANAGRTSWAEFARTIFERSAQRGGPSARVTGIATADYPTPARRPAMSLLDCTSMQRAFGFTPRPWQDALDDVLDELIGSKR